MNDISNRSIVALLAVALVITVIGTAVSVSKLDGLQNRYNVLTGAVTSSSSSGQTNITITSTTEITLGNSNMNFGTGRVNATCSQCSMDSNRSVSNVYTNQSTVGGNIATDDRNCCLSFSAVSSGFLIENTGNVNVSVGYTCAGNCTRSSFIGGSFAGPIARGNSNGLDIKITPQVTRSEAGEQGTTDITASCVGGGTLYRDSGWNITNSSTYSQSGASYGAPAQTYLALSPQGHWLCGNYTNSPLMPDQVKNAGVLDINLTVTNDALGTGVRSSLTLTFNATSQ